MQNHRAFEVEENNSVLILIRKNNHKMELSCTYDQYLAGIRAYNRGALMQEAFSFLPADEREFLISGMTSQEFDAIFAKKKH
jgi:hypothetical protein